MKQQKLRNYNNYVNIEFRNIWYEIRVKSIGNMCMKNRIRNFVDVRVLK